jgi:hypothetical protein
MGLKDEEFDNYRSSEKVSTKLIRKSYQQKVFDFYTVVLLKFSAYNYFWVNFWWIRDQHQTTSTSFRQPIAGLKGFLVCLQKSKLINIK